MQPDPLQNVRDSAKFIMQKAQHIQINDQEIEKTAAVIAKEVWEKLGNTDSEKAISNDGFVESLLIEWDNEQVHFKNAAKEPELTAQYILVLSALNFCFWQGCLSAEAIAAHKYDQTQEFEYHDLAGNLRDVLKNNPFAFEAQLLQKVTEETLFQWFKQRQVPLASERARLLREIGYELSQRYNGLAANMILQAKKSAAKLVSLVTSSFPGFRDHAIDPMSGKQLFFYKRAQIFVADIYGAFGGKGLGEFTDMHKLTMFADYRVPQILRHYNILTYSKELSEHIDTLKLLPSGSLQEIEIRASTIECVERLKSVLEKNNRIRVKSIELDWWLWQKGEEKRNEIAPHHRTLTIYY
jgi:hypothetical protein